MFKMKADFKIKANFGQDIKARERFSKDMQDFLSPLKENN